MVSLFVTGAAGLGAAGLVTEYADSLANYLNTQLPEGPSCFS